MGRGFVAQVEGIPGMEVVTAADLDTEVGGAVAEGFLRGEP